VLAIVAVWALIWYSSSVLYTEDRPYDLNGVLGNQEYMFNYHSKLTTDRPHPFASRWWSWPLNIRPVFLFQGEGYAAEYMSSMSTMGNPAVWWGALGAVIALVVIRLRHGKIGKRTFFLGIAAASQYVPWVIISRETFIYHYFETIPFLILLTAVLAKYLIERTRHGKKAVFIYLGVCLVLFILFYPVTTGFVIPRSYADIIRWLPTWPFY
jgi:dolichyl-phosphate-mannose--protein O-mannosyl transferase